MESAKAFLSKYKIIKIIIYIEIQLFCFSMIGYIFMGPEIFDPQNNIFTFTIFGTTAVLYINILEFGRMRKFLVIGIIIAVFFIASWFDRDNLVIIFRNACWFVLIGVAVYYSRRLLNIGQFKGLKIGPILLWMVAFILAYAIMAILDIYVFDIYIALRNQDILFYLKQALKVGGLLGIGIGVGYQITKYIETKTFRPSPEANQTVSKTS